MNWVKSTYSSNINCLEAATDERTASYSFANGNCVTCGTCHIDGVHVRDSKDPDGPRLAFPAGAWREFTAGLR